MTTWTSSATTTVMTDSGAEIEMTFPDRDTAVVRLDADPAGTGARAAGLLMCEAITEARRRRARYLRTVLELARPLSGIVLDAVRNRIGHDAQAIDLRRAGSSVIVTVDLGPLPSISAA